MLRVILRRVDREAVRFYVTAFLAGTVGSLIGMQLGWGETGVFVAGMGPVAVVILIFILREPRDEAVCGDLGSAGGAETSSRSFFVTAVGAALLGSVIAMALGWSDDAVFAAGMVPLAIVMGIFILREARDGQA